MYKRQYQGRYESNSGLVLLGGPQKGFSPRWSSQTGFSLSGEIRSIRPLSTADGRQWWVVARSNGSLLTFRQAVSGSFSAQKHVGVVKKGGRR